MKDLLLSICICLHIIYTLHDHYIYKYCLTTLSRCRDMNTSFFNFSLHFLSSGQLLCFNNHMGKYTRIYLYIYHIDLNLILFSSFSRTSILYIYYSIGANIEIKDTEGSRHYLLLQNSVELTLSKAQFQKEQTKT